MVARVNKGGSTTDYLPWTCPTCDEVIYVAPEDAGASFRCFGNLPGDPEGIPSFHLPEPYATAYLHRHQPWWRQMRVLFLGWWKIEREWSAVKKAIRNRVK